MAKHIHIHIHKPTKDAGAWEESKHKRAANGQFGSGGGGGTKPLPGAGNLALKERQAAKAAQTAAKREQAAKAGTIMKGKGVTLAAHHARAPEPAAHSWEKSSAAKNASRAAERSTQGGGGDPHALHTAASKAHAEAAEEANARGDRVNAQMHSDKSVMHASQAKLHAPAGGASSTGRAPHIKGPVQKGHQVEFKPEYKDDGDDDIKWVALENEDGGRVRVIASNSPMRIKPTQVVTREMLSNVSS